MVLCLFFSCSDKNKTKIDVSNIKVNFSIKRYDVDFYNAAEETLPNVKEKYPYLFPESFSDSLAIAKINDKEEQELFAETQKKYKDFSDLESQLTTLFKNIKYYNSKFKSPDIVTILTNIDYDSRVIYADSLLFISLDVYLGKEHSFYTDYPKYIKENNTKENIIVDVANSVIKTQFHSYRNRSFINKIISEGKKLYLLDKYLPDVSDNLKIGYPIDKLNWAIENEEQVWKYFVEKKILLVIVQFMNLRLRTFH